MVRLVMVTIIGKLIMKIVKMSLSSIFFLFILFNIAEPYVQADELYNNLSEVSQGSLLIRNEEGYFKALPLLDTQVKLSISSLVARATVRQFFENTSEDFVEAKKIYQQTKKQGKKTALLEQKRANIFTTNSQSPYKPHCCRANINTTRRAKTAVKVYR